MAGKPNDTSTQVNLGVGGDLLDETLVTQADGTTTAKRARVAMGDDAGKVLTFTKGVDGQWAVPTYDSEALMELRDVNRNLVLVLLELQTLNRRFNTEGQ